MADWSKLYGSGYLCPCVAFYNGKWVLPLTPTPAQSFAQMNSVKFNFARVPAAWAYLASSESDFMSILNQIVAAGAANDVALDILFSGTFPLDMLNYYGAGLNYAEPGYDNMMIAWWQNKATYSWQNMIDEFWTPIIQAIDSSPAVISYEIMNEPYAPGSVTVAQEQAHNQFFATALRKLTSKAIVYMADCTSSLENQGNTIVSVAPTGISNLVLDLHRYSTSDPSSDFASWSADAAKANCSGVFVGEWGPDSSCPASIDTTTEQNTIDLYYAAFRKYGLGNAYFAWGPGTGPCNLTDTNNNPNWIANLISQQIQAIPAQPTTLTLKVTQV